MAAIEILGLEKTYMVGFWRKRPKCALRPLQLTVEEGEIFGFLGPNGAGKTTTLKMLMGLVFPSSPISTTTSRLTNCSTTTDNFPAFRRATASVASKRFCPV